MKEALINGDISNIINRYNFLRDVEGIPDPEARRTIHAEFGVDMPERTEDITNMNVSDWQPDKEAGGNNDPTGELTLKIFDSGYPPIPPLPVFSITMPYDNDGIDHKNPDPQRPEGYAGGRKLEQEEYHTNAPGNTVVRSQEYPRDDQFKKNYDLSPFTPPAQTPTLGTGSFVKKKRVPEWPYDIEDDQGGVAEVDLGIELPMVELIVDRDKKTGRWVKHGTTKGDLITDHSLAPILDRARKDYLQRQWDGKIEEPHMVTDEPEDKDDPHIVTEAPLDPITEVEEPIYARYIYQQPHERGDVCMKFHRKVYDLTKLNRPVPPSEGLGYTTTHPNCQCYWDVIKKPKKVSKATPAQQREFDQIEKHITKKAKQGKLHTVHEDGTLSKRTRKSNPLRETIEEVRHDFKWLSDAYLSRVKSIDVPGKFFLIRASNEAITDHRGEGEPYRRWLSPDELHAMARTATGKKMDVNHHYWLETDAEILDSEYDKDRKEIQMLVHEADPEILRAIDNKQITAVSINGGSPRSMEVECPDCQSSRNCECFIVPQGVILGESDGIALTWVVTDPHGISFHGQLVPPATPGVKTTAFQQL